MISDLKLLAAAPLAAAIIGRGGHTVRRLKIESGVTTIHLSHNELGVVDRTVCLTGEQDAICKAYTLVAEVLRTEAGLTAGAIEIVRLVVPDAESLLGPSALQRLHKASGATIECAAAAAGASEGSKERVVTCTGSAEQTELAAQAMAKSIASRQHQRHKGFLSKWEFATNYNDHFETPFDAYSHIKPLLAAIALRRHPPSGQKRKRGDDCTTADIATASLEDLVVYDPYYCQGKVCTDLAALGLAKERVINENRDFYADIASGSTPPHDALVTNPPYSADHKQRLLDFLLAPHLEKGDAPPAPFMLLMPAWLVATDYWLGFLERLAAARGKPSSSNAGADDDAGASSARKLEQRAGVFYVSPCTRYAFTHPEATGHATSPFHSVWFCGGWPTKGQRREALAALRPLRAQHVVEVFRASAMMQKRSHFTPASQAKQLPASDSNDGRGKGGKGKSGKGKGGKGKGKGF